MIYADLASFEVRDESYLWTVEAEGSKNKNVS